MLKTQSLYQRKNRNQNKPFSLIEEQSQRTSNLLKSQRYKKKTNGPVLMNPGRTLPRDQLSSHRENNPSLLSPPVISTLNTDCAIPLYPVSLCPHSNEPRQGPAKKKPAPPVFLLHIGKDAAEERKGLCLQP